MTDVNLGGDQSTNFGLDICISNMIFLWGVYKGQESWIAIPAILNACGAVIAVGVSRRAHGIGLAVIKDVLELALFPSGEVV